LNAAVGFPPGCGGTAIAVLTLVSIEEQAMDRRVEATTKSAPAGEGLRTRDEQQERLKKRDPGQGIVPDDRGQDQPVDKRRAERDSGLREQWEAARQSPPSPGQPAHGE
jgi:hypothetical protein